MNTVLNNLSNWMKADYWRSAFVLLISILFFAIVRLSLDAGMSGDEHFHAAHAAHVYEFYRTFGKDTAAITITDLGGNAGNLPTYGQVVDNLAHAIYRWIGSDDEMKVRHVTNSIFGWLAILFTALIGFRVSRKWYPTIIIALLMFFSPRFLGHSFNNLKDLPMATAMIMGLYYILAFLQDFPKVKKSTMIMVAVSIGFAIAVRIGGLLLIAYFGLFCAMLFIKNYGLKGLWTKPNSKLFGKMFKWGLIIVVGGYALAMLLWPYGMVSPIENPKFVLSYMSQFTTDIRQNFEGAMIWSGLLPWYYTPKFILMTIPIAVIIGAILYPFLGGLKKDRWFETFVIAFAFLFPIIFITYTGANVYGGWRHSIFAYPPMVALAGLGFWAFAEWLKKRLKNQSENRIYIIVLIGVIGLLYSPIRHTIRNHPYQYVYFNELIGGMKGAFGNYELDYYYHSTREGSEWIIKHAERTGLETTEKIRVATWHPASVTNFFRNDTAKFEVTFSRWHERGRNDWDYAIFTVTGMSPDMLKSDVFPPANTVYQIKVDGFPIAIVLKRTDKSDFYGDILKREGNLDSAIVLLKKSLNIVPSDESVLLNLAEIYINRQQSDSAILFLDKLLAFDPKNETANYYKAFTLWRQQNRLDEAQKYLQTIINHNPKNSAASWESALIYATQGNLILMERMIERTLVADPGKQQEALSLIQQVYSRMNFSTNDANIAFTRIWITVLERLGYKEEAQRIRNQR